MSIYELLIQGHDNTSPVADRDKECYKKGDVICIKPVGWKWIEGERKNVVKADLTKQEVIDFTASEFGTVKKSSGGFPIEKRRKYGSDITPDPNTMKTISKTDIGLK